MSTYRKEKNLIYFTIDGYNKDFTLDINTGVFYGISGRPLKNCPCNRKITDMLPRYQAEETSLDSILYYAFRCERECARIANYAKAMRTADKIDALKLISVLRLDRESLEYIDDNFKYFLTYMKNRDNNANFSFYNFQNWAEYEKIKNSLGDYATQFTPEMYSNLLSYLENPTLKEIQVCAYYCTRGKYWNYHGSMYPLAEYFKWCRMLNIEPQKVNNFMREYCETKEYYQLRKTEFDNKTIQQNYAKQAKAWEFEYGNYTIIIPTCGQDLVTEGQRMHHCVGSYVDNIIGNTCYICFVRNKETPDECYITCQVHTNGWIGQYYLSYDRLIYTEEDIAFKEAFQKHLRSVWND